MTIEDLIARLSKAEGPSRELDALIAVTVDGFFEVPPRYEGDDIGYGYFGEDGTRIEPGHGGTQLVRKYTSSLDAAYAFAERVVPGCKISLFINHLTGAKDGSGARASVSKGKGPKCPHTGIRWPRVEGDCYHAKTAPLALVTATLKAAATLRAEKEGRV